MSGERTKSSITWELWRSHLRGGPDLRLRGEMGWEQARREWASIQDDADYLASACRFYLVRVVEGRQEWAVAPSEAPEGHHDDERAGEGE